MISNLLIRRIFPHTTQWVKCQKYSATGDQDQKLASLAEKNLPDGILRKTKEGEIIGPGADKNGIYKNPEYYSTTKWSFIDLNLFMSKFRCGQPDPKKTKSTFPY